jgi:hypothetical protein
MDEVKLNTAASSTTLTQDQSKAIDNAALTYDVQFKAGEPQEYNIQFASPIVLDFRSMGFIPTLPLDKGVKFDINADGFAEETGWVKGSEGGFLVLDLDGNGRIESGLEMFGQYTKLPNGENAHNGYLALKQYDTNKDGVINSQDPIYEKLQIWFDHDVNGYTTPFELKSLKLTSVTSIELGYTEVPQYAAHSNGNKIEIMGKFHGPKSCPATGCNTYDILFNTGYNNLQVSQIENQFREAKSFIKRMVLNKPVKKSAAVTKEGSTGDKLDY